MKYNAIRAFTASLLAGATILSPSSGSASLLAHFRLNDGALDSSTNTIASSVGSNTGVFYAGTAIPVWTTTGLPPIPATEGGSTAYLDYQVPLPALSGGYITTDVYAPTGGLARTFSAWVKVPASMIGQNAGLGTLLSYGTTAPNFTRFSFRVDPANGGKLRTEIAGAAVVGNTVVADGNWHHVAVVAPENARMSNLVLYVDGNRQTFTVNSAPSQALLTGTGTSALYPVHLGVSIHNFGATFLGGLDDVRIYDEALSDNQIIQMVYGSGTAPAIGRSPVNAAAILGATNSTASFSVGLSSGSPPLSFRWKRDDANLTSGTNQILTISPVTVASIGRYNVGITNPFGGVLSTSATLSWSTPLLEPSELTVLQGGIASWSIKMPSESTGYTYQWLKAGADILGATTSSYTISSATLADANSYSVRVQLAGQTAISTPAPLKVVPVPSSLYARSVLESGAVAAYWRLGDQNGSTVAQDTTTLHTGYLSNFFGSELQSPGAVSQDPDTSATFNGVDYIELPYSPALQHPFGFTLEAWVKADASGGRQSVICSRNQYFSSGYELAGSGVTWQFRTGYATSPASEFWNDLSGGTILPGEWQHLVATYDGTTKRLYVDGREVGSQSLPVFAVEVPVRIGAGRTFQPSPADFFLGSIDEAAIYSRAISPSEVARHYGIAKYGPNTPPILLQQPESLTNYAGGLIRLTVLAEGSFPIAYQWARNGTTIPGATESTFVIRSAAPGDAGTYSALISNGAGATNTTPVTLTIVPVTQTGYRAVVMNDSPAAYFPLDETLGDTLALELYNFGAYHGQYINSSAQQTPGATPATGYSLDLDGASQSITFENYPGLNISGECSLEAWIKPLTNYAGGGYGNIIAHGFGGSPTRELALRVFAGAYQIVSYDGANYGVNYAVPANDIGTWVHLVGTYDGVAWNLFRNGTLVARSTNSVGALTVADGWAIGSRSTVTERFFQGGIDEPAIYSHGLSPAQVARHYLRATGQSATLSISKPTPGTLSITWNAGLLEEASDVAGPWSSLVAATSPYTASSAAGKKFYRVRW